MVLSFAIICLTSTLAQTLTLRTKHVRYLSTNTNQKHELKNFVGEPSNVFVGQSTGNIYWLASSGMSTLLQMVDIQTGEKTVLATKESVGESMRCMFLTQDEQVYIGGAARIFKLERNGTVVVVAGSGVIGYLDGNVLEASFDG